MPSKDAHGSSEAEASEDPILKKAGGTNGLWDDDDFASLEQEKDAKAAEDEEGNAEVPTGFLCCFEPLKGKSGKHVLKAIQEVVLQLRMEISLQFGYMQIELMNCGQRLFANGPSTITSCLHVRRDRRPSRMEQQKGQSGFSRAVHGPCYDLQDWGHNTGRQLWQRRLIVKEESLWHQGGYQEEVLRPGRKA